MADLECAIQALAAQKCTFENGQFGEIFVFPPEPRMGFETIGVGWKPVNLYPVLELKRLSEKLGVSWDEVSTQTRDCMRLKESIRESDSPSP